MDSESKVWLIASLFLNIILVIMYVSQKKNINKLRNKINPSNYVPKDEKMKLVEKNIDLSQENMKLKETIGKLNRNIEELERDNAGLLKLVGQGQSSPVLSQHSIQEVNFMGVQEHKEVPKDEKKYNSIELYAVSSKRKTIYASFPRSAGSSLYFSDLSGNLVDDSYFELTVDATSNQATFKPLDFMKIRNYDPAMTAMLTEGVKPNMASTVVGIEPGKAHIEGKDWIIDKPAKIKLA